MLVLILISFVTSSLCEPQSCNEYCSFILAGNIGTAWKTLCSCPPEGNKSSIIGRNVKYYPIFYEPTELYHVANISLNPFTISNPSAHNESSPTVAQDAQHRRKYKRKDIFFDSKHKETERRSLYLDIDVRKNADLGRSSQILDNLYTLDLSEQDLKVCIDLYKLKYFRENGPNDMNQIMNDNNMIKYSKISDANLKKELDNRCNLASNVLRENLREIEIFFPKRNTSNFFDLINSDHGHKITSKFVSKDVREVNDMFVPASTVLSKSFSEDATCIYTSEYDKNRQKLNPYNRIQKENNNQKNIARQYKIQDVFLESIQTQPELNNQINVSFKSKPGGDVKEEKDDIIQQHLERLNKTQVNTISHDETRLNSVDNVTEISNQYFVSEPSTINDTMNVQQDTDSTYGINELYLAVQPPKNAINFNIPVPQSNDLILETEWTTESELAKTLMLNLIDNDTDTLMRIDDSNKSISKRPFAVRSEIRTPTIDVTEHLNYTNSSTIDESHDLPDSDYDANITESKYESIPYSNGSLTYNNYDDREEVGNNEISGNIYFMVNKLFIPLRFVQSPEGRLNLALDGNSFCENLVKDKNKHGIISVLCNFATNKYNND